MNCTITAVQTGLQRKLNMCYSIYHTRIQIYLQVYDYFWYSMCLFLIQYMLISDTVCAYFWYSIWLFLIQYMIISDTVYDYFW